MTSRPDDKPAAAAPVPEAPREFAPRVLPGAAAVQLGVDPGCRYARAAREYPTVIVHTCRRRDGRPVRPGVDDCFAEAFAQFRELKPDAS